MQNQFEQNKKNNVGILVLLLYYYQPTGIFATARLIFFFLFFSSFIIYYIFKIRTRPDSLDKERYKRLFIFDMFFIFSILSVNNIIQNFLNINPLQGDYISALVVSLSTIFLIIRSLLLMLPFGLKGLFLMTIFLFLIGYFKSEWWTGISLLTTLSLFVYSDDLLILMSNTKIDKKEIPYDLKRRFIRGKFFILIGNIAIYFSLVISNELKDKKVVDRLAKFLSEQSQTEKTIFEDILALSIVRIIVFFIITFIFIIASLWLFKSNKFFKDFKDFTDNISSNE